MAEAEGEEAAAVEVDPIEEKYGPIFEGLLKERADIVASLDELASGFDAKVAEATGKPDELDMLQLKSKAAREYHTCALAPTCIHTTHPAPPTPLPSARPSA